jgi:single-stranded-DNA-specific exonuclease
MRIINGLKYHWKVPDHDPQVLFQKSMLHNVSLPIAQMLMTRGITTDNEIDQFFFGTQDTIGSAHDLKDGLKAIDRLLSAIANKEKILIVGDYDVDGVTASALVLIALRELGAVVNYFLPNRVRDGYGLSRLIVHKAAANNYKVIITVDNGISAHDAADAAREHGIDLIITDHHQVLSKVPAAYAIVNPHQPDCPYAFKYLAGVGVAFKLMEFLYQSLHKELPACVYELLVLGTVADVVPLVGENRYWVRRGLTELNKHIRPPMAVLCKNAKVVRELITSLDIGFGIAPQINALGRLDDARAAVRFLLSNNEKESVEIGGILYSLNEERKLLERRVYDEVVQQINNGIINLANERVIIAYNEHWPVGVIGLVAGRLANTYGRPVLLFHATAHGTLKGSGRSIAMFNLCLVLEKFSDLLAHYGGHALAVGVSLLQSNFETFKAALQEYAFHVITAEDLVQELLLDGTVCMQDITAKMGADLVLCEPFGCQNPQPIFYMQGVILAQEPQLLKEAHVKCLVYAEGVNRSMIIFNRPDLYMPLCAQGQKPFDAAVMVTKNYWNGVTTMQLQAMDLAGVSV